MLKKIIFFFCRPAEEKPLPVQTTKAEQASVVEKAPVTKQIPVKEAPADALFADSSSLELPAFLQPLSADEETF